MLMGVKIYTLIAFLSHLILQCSFFCVHRNQQCAATLYLVVARPT